MMSSRFFRTKYSRNVSEFRGGPIRVLRISFLQSFEKQARPGDRLLYFNYNIYIHIYICIYFILS